jgi:predicted HTH transcriptional regulator
MAEILVKKSELKNIRDGINKMLQSKEQNVIKTPQYAAYETQELSERQKEILKYVEKNPGCTKEDVIKNLDLGSRMTIVKAIKDLIDIK